MTEVTFSKLMWEREREGRAMESCYKLYTWINHTILMLLLQIFWKMSQISDYFKEKSIEDKKTDSFIFSPLSKESKLRRHIRSMSDVQSSTPYRLPFRSRKGKSKILTYDSDTRSKRIMTYNRHKILESSDSSDFDAAKSNLCIEHIKKHTDSMRVL
ncbi:PREDICTED: uncharacterized protein LOC106121501 [Papilio xuthus]|uniref:Uncharacterized protein LOC106121501 n=1 Tax=Papilio xuthus TaxID=66420 RepID=A0A194PW91_PAPXU|nr:PREDICTED: uncharacterized protein LOC106121501 [Papilio xuthus]KPI97268.1 hypothetical protein RR46_09175 [Papilio xuthus]